MYRVIKAFADLKDRKHFYHVGDTYPRDGVVVSEDRVNELSGKRNAMGVPLIEQVEQKRKRRK